MSPIGRFADLTHANTAINAGDAHPLGGTIESSVLFLVKVAAERLTLVNEGIATLLKFIQIPCTIFSYSFQIHCWLSVSVH